RRELARWLAVRRGWIIGAAAAFALLVWGAAVAWVAARADAAARLEEAQRRNALDGYVEQGRREWLAGDAPPAAADPGAALAGGVDRPAVRFLLARALSPLEQTYTELRPLAGAVTAAELLRAGPRLILGTQTGAIVLYGADGQAIRAFVGHRGRIRALVLDAAERRLLSASDDGTARRWDLATGECAAELVGHGRPVVGVRFTAGERAIVTAGQDATARLWDLDGREVARLVHDGPVTAVVPGPARVVYTAAEDATARSWDAATGAPLRVLRGHGGPVIALDVDPSGTRLATGSRDGTARGWGAGDGAPGRAFRHDGPVPVVRFGARDRLLTGADDRLARLWDVSTGASVTLAGHEGPLTAARVTFDGARIVTASMDGSVRVWDVATGRSVAALVGHRQGVLAVAVDLTGSRILSGSDDGTARLWAGAPGPFLGWLSPSDERYPSAWFGGPDQVIAVDEGGDVGSFRARAGSWVPAGSPLPVCLRDGARRAVSADGTRLAAASERVV